ncbi:MAG TPA: tannase/feruloyl esterase family alpha/beta hydrolase [Casimicrobiaceae bacterium]
MKTKTRFTHTVRTVLRTSAVWIGGTLGMCGAAHAVDCGSLISVTSDSSTMTAADSITPPATIGGAAVTVPFCRVQGTARPTSDSEIKFEVWLPPTVGAWTGRMKVNGTGGYAGATPYARLAQDVGDGFVSAGSNMGHDGGESATWTLGHPEKVKDWGLRAHFYVATAAKTLANAFYGQPVAHSYFEGCSNGGRQALMMAQNYPTLFDGIAAGAPSNFYPDVLMWLLWSGVHQTPVFGQPAVVSPAKRTAITQRVLQACDAIDGLVDGQITNPRACVFNIDSMGPAGDGTLTAAELAVAKAMYAGTTSESGQQRYTGAKFGGEADWDPNFADNGGYGPFIGHYVYGVLSPPFDWRRDVNFSTVYDQTKAAVTPITAAPSPDLTAFKNHGGKLIQFAGWNDSVVPPDGSVNYYHSLALFEKLHTLPSPTVDALVNNLTPQDVATTAQFLGDRVRQYHRLFLLPAVAHCGGSTGPSSIGGGMPEPPAAFRDADHHVVSAVIKWVEQGVAPERIIATRFSGSTLTLSRPVCPYPAQAVYNGSGDINVASNFTCAPQIESASSIGPGDIIEIKNSLTQRALELPNR